MHVRDAGVSNSIVALMSPCGILVVCQYNFQSQHHVSTCVPGIGTLEARCGLHYEFIAACLVRRCLLIKLWGEQAGFVACSQRRSLQKVFQHFLYPVYAIVDASMNAASWGF